jgi:four helix bundle protein
LTVAVYIQTKSFPKEEIYGLTSQLRRASYSVPANIVEGASRDSKKDYLHFLYIARGSLSEAQYFVHLAARLGYLHPDQAADLREQTKQVFACLHGLIRAVEKEAGKINKVIATLSSLVALGLAHWSRGLVARAA